jgi:hypothetical protein
LNHLVIVVGVIDHDADIGHQANRALDLNFDPLYIEMEYVEGSIPMWFTPTSVVT